MPDQDADDDADEPCGHGRRYLGSRDVVSCLGAIAETVLRNGSLLLPTAEGTAGDRDSILANAATVLDEDVFRKTGHLALMRGPLLDPGACALLERHPCFWRSVGLIAGALMWEKTLDGTQVDVLVGIARRGESHPT